MKMHKMFKTIHMCRKQKGNTWKQQRTAPHSSCRLSLQVTSLSALSSLYPKLLTAHQHTATAFPGFIYSHYVTVNRAACITALLSVGFV